MDEKRVIQERTQKKEEDDFRFNFRHFSLKVRNLEVLLGLHEGQLRLNEAGNGFF